MLNRATLNMIVLKQANNLPVKYVVGFEMNYFIYYSGSYTDKTPKLIITRITKNN